MACIILAIGYFLGPSSILLFYPATLINIVILIARIIPFLTKRQTLSWINLTGVFTSILWIVGLFAVSKGQIEMAKKEFKASILELKEFKLKNGYYPDELKQAGISSSPYHAFSSPRYFYHKSPDKPAPLFCMVEIPPFGRKCFNFELNRETYLD